ncbi:helix-turn-helix domain-containing protein [Streptomyces caniscabiei]|uniref:Helix-turn-helix domain-containing protein n=1 Tax=Streptomyces caniscabiei TaxID=2746961 RepID=A0A927KY79_9ACTN|nr:helix-turn-helix domain-containing protein [Streptomyces caniscabiei]MBD9721897.1 helix-turn-helix domain-containing protein [Streptomyces caniscabiei]MDX3509088.1 helix-turn-helix domain-containing protein [Streptomyces caniscabiei]MDX3717159.1 helix-turn-helix domain-containing protein [Streptomyces caniscabiei]WEO23026.1 helix-turn-helix domain-containing protein [Streptomyces caniscabiei]
MPRPAKTPTPPPPPPGHVWIDEAARRMSVTINTLYNYRQQGKGPVGIPSPRRLAYRVADIDAYLAERTQRAINPLRSSEARPAEVRTPRRQPARAAA